MNSSPEHKAAQPPRIVEGSVDDLATALLETAPGARLFRISDANVDALHGAALDAALQRHGAEVHTLVIEPGEEHKSLETVAALWASLIQLEVRREDCIVALGGGVTGDLAAFVAATILRGIRFVQVPTTVLAMCDAAIGGKCGFNLKGKNLVGAFAAPERVLHWYPLLDTLPQREFAAGLAEVVKSALIEGEEALVALEEDARQLAARDPDASRRAILSAASTKCTIVEQDYRESGARKLLNLGHTFAHVIETATGYGDFNHGEAVAMGMVLAARASRQFIDTETGLETRLRSLLETLGLPTDAPTLPADTWTTLLRRDKKRLQDDVQLILVQQPGSLVLHPTAPNDLAVWLADGAPLTVTPDAATAR